MPVYNIPIYGLIGSPETKEDKALYFKYTDLLLHLNKAKAYDTLNLDIASDGGYCDVADRMIEAIKATGKFITSCNSGNVCSAASKIFTLAPKGSRTFHSERGVFLIHNPWSDVQGDASQMAQAAKKLKSIENEYASWYEAATGTEANILLQFMAENVPLTPEQIESLGFATIVKPVVKAVAKLKSINTMKENEIIEKMNGFEKFFKQIFAKLKIKALMLADANGKELEFPDINDVAELATGIKVLENGAPANGEYPQADGSVLKCENGILVEIVPAAPADNSEALQKENEALKAEIATLKAAKTTAETEATQAKAEVVNVKAEFVKFKSQFSDFKFKGPKPEEDDKNKPQSRKPFKTV